MTLGQPGVAGDGTGPLLNTPCDIHVAPNGDIFVSDGHGGQGANANIDTVARIVKFDANGSFIDSWGQIGTAPGEFRTPHGLAMDSRGRLFVADRGNLRIQIFDQDGNFIDQWKQFSRVSGIYIDDNDLLYAADSESSSTSNPGWKRGLRVGNAITGHVPLLHPRPGHGPRRHQRRRGSRGRCGRQPLWCGGRTPSTRQVCQARAVEFVIAREIDPLGYNQRQPG